MKNVQTNHETKPLAAYDANKYSGKRVFITGITGFKGSWLAYSLYMSGAEVFGFALAPEEQSLFNILGLNDKIKWRCGDVRDKGALSDAVLSFDPHFVFHLAAQAIVSMGYSKPTYTFETNVIGVANVCDVCRNLNSIVGILIVTSDKAYENKEWVWGYSEKDELGGADPYSASKGAAEIVLSSFYRSFWRDRNVGFVSARAGNVIGGGDWSQHRLVPDLMRSYIHRKAFKIRNPNAVRPWQHVMEPVAAYLKLCWLASQHPTVVKGSYNFGPNTEDAVNVAQMINQIKLALDDDFPVEFEQNFDMEEANLLVLNCDKAKRILSWSPRWNLNKTVLMTAQWYSAYKANQNMTEVTKNQINEYNNQ